MRRISTIKTALHLILKWDHSTVAKELTSTVASAHLKKGNSSDK